MDGPEQAARRDAFLRDLRLIGFPEEAHMHADYARRMGLVDGQVITHEHGQTTRIRTYGTPEKEPAA